MLKSPFLISLFLLLVSCQIIVEGSSISPSQSKVEENYDVIIVGAGMAGSSAALQLSKSGKKVLILQANDYIGGRMKTKKVGLLGGRSLNFQYGANWIHGSNPANPITQLANEMGNVSLIWTNYQSFNVYDEQGTNITASADQKYIQYEQLFSNFDESKNKQKSIEDVLKQKHPWTLEDKQFMFAISNNFQFDQAADIDQVNSQFIQGLEWIDADDQLVVSGYQRLPQYLVQKSRAKVLLNHKVIQVSKDKKQRSTIKCQNGFEASAQTIVIAVPLGVLKKNTIQFIPDLPAWKRQAIRKIGFGNVVKILIVPKKVLNFKQTTQFVGIVANNINQRGSATFFLDFQNFVNQTAMMTFGLGANADQLQMMPQFWLKALIAKRLSVLSTSPISSDDFDIIRSFWRTDPNFGGSYSFPGLQTSIEEWENMARPMKDRNLYFCGEHTYNTLRSTVNGAYLSGIVAAKNILARLKIQKNEEI